jgi:hypothetical protein
MMRAASIADLARYLAEGELTIQIHPGVQSTIEEDNGWVVWLYPADDPVQCITSTSEDLDTAVNSALEEWGGWDEDGGKN